MHLIKVMHPFNVPLCFPEVMGYSDNKLQNVLHFKSRHIESTQALRSDQVSLLSQAPLSTPTEQAQP